MLRLALAFLSACGVERAPAPPQVSPIVASTTRPTALDAAFAAHPDSKMAENAACERCHTDIAAEWRGSLHARSWDDPLFLSAYAIEPLPFCRACHAPEAPPEETSSPARHLGVACITCHVPEGVRTVDTEIRTHAVFKARGADKEGCASCHQFEFPDRQEAAMQSTVEEHAASPQRDQSCAHCHMPQLAAGRPHKDHGFRVQGDTEMLRRSLAVSAQRGLERTIDVTLVARGAGHAVPTGDMFRQLEVRATAGDGPDSVKATPVVLAREFELVRTEQGPRRQQVRDRRVPANGEPALARLVFPRPVASLPVRWEVIYRRVGPREAQLFGVDLEAEAVVLASGTIEGRAPP